MSELLSQLEPLKQEALTALAGAGDLAALDQVKGRYVGPQGQFTALMKQLGTLAKEERPAAGKQINAVKAELDAMLTARREELALKAALPKEPIDFTAPGRRRRLAFLPASKCRLPEWEHITLPVPVILNRLATDFLVLLPRGRRIG
jgi:phenylalanyl-tRNA synthetase alpha chain